MSNLTRKVEKTMNVAIARAGLQPTWQKPVDNKMPALGLKTGVTRLPGLRRLKSMPGQKTFI